MSEALEAIEPFDADPPRLLTDANFNEHVVRGLRRIRPEIFILTAHQAEVDTLVDPDLLAYAAQQDLILLTHDTHHVAAFCRRPRPTQPGGLQPRRLVFASDAGRRHCNSRHSRSMVV